MIQKHSKTKLIFTILLITLACAPVTVYGQKSLALSYASPEQVGMSSAVLSGGAGLYQEAVDRGDLVGAVLMVVRRGKIVLHEAVGWKDKGRNLPMEPNTMFRMASNTKPLIATAIAQLVEEGKLSYSDLVRDYIPEWDNYRSGFISIGHLLSHSSGLRISSLFLEPLMQPSEQHPDAPNLLLESARYGSIGAEVTPGLSYSYNNPGYNTLAALIEMSSGQLLEEYLEENVYSPLGMEDSYNHQIGHTLEGKLDRMGEVYYRRSTETEEWLPGGTPGGPVAFPFARGSGGMISTAFDYAIFCQMLLNEGSYNGSDILTKESVGLLTSPKISSGETDSYGFGFRIENGVYGHSGSDGTRAWVDPPSETIALVFTQTPGAGREEGNPWKRFRDLVNLSIDNE
jgi:CubicO group peptidase (beta-lactamase class C family)